MAIIPFGEWRPDAGALGSHALIAKNVIPFVNGYRSIKDVSPFTNALAAYCRGAVSMINKTGTIYSYFGTETNLYSLSDISFTSRGSGYSTVSDGYWEFAQWGDSIIATNFSDAVQTMALGGSSFSALGGSPPQARYIGIVGDFVVLGNTYDGVDGYVPNRIRWSGIGDETSWTVSATTQADYQDLQGNGGWVQKVVSGEVGVVLQERAIWTMRYVGSPIVFQIDQVEQSRGTIEGRSVAVIGDMIFYIYDDGFYMYRNGTSVNISEGKVSRWFFSELDFSNKHRINSSFDIENEVVMWAFPAFGNTGGRPNKIIMFHWPTGKWSYAEIETEVVFGGLTQGYTLDGLDSVSSSIDALTDSLDSRIWAGGNIKMFAVDPDHKVGTFTGSVLEGVIDTGEFQPIEGKTALIKKARVMANGGTHKVSIGSRFNQVDPITWTGIASENTSGFCPVRSNGRYHRIRSYVSDDYADAHGIEIDVSVTGDR